MTFRTFAGFLLCALAGPVAILSGCNSPSVPSSSTIPTLTSIAVTPATASVAIGATQQFEAIGTYSDSSTKDLTSTVTWTSSRVPLATISTAGLATAVAAGTSNILATSGGISGHATLIVAPTLTSIAVTPASLTVAIGATQQFTATGSFSDSSTKDLTSTATWSSDTTSVATISAAGLATATASGTTNIVATSKGVSGHTVLTVSLPLRNYSGTASVGDFLSIVIDPNKNTLTYTNLTNDATGTASYVVNADGSATINDPDGHLLSVSEVPGYGIVALMDNAGSTGDQLALVTSTIQQNVTAASFANQNYNIFEFRTRGGGVGISSISIDDTATVTGTEFMPFNLLSSGSNNLGFNIFSPFQLPSGPPAPYLKWTSPSAPPGDSMYVFGVSNGMFLVDTPDGSIIGLPKASKPDFDPSWAGTYSLPYYKKSNANGPDGNSPEAGSVSWGVATLVLDQAGNLSLKDSDGDTMASGTLNAIANTPWLYNGVTTDGTSGELGDPSWGMFALVDSNDTNTIQQPVFVAFAQGAVLLSSFATTMPFHPGDDYDYFYGVGLPKSATFTASTGSSSNSGGSSGAIKPGAWNSLAPNYTPGSTVQRNYIASSTNGDLLTVTIDPTTNTLSYYDYTSGQRSDTPSNIDYTLNADGITATVNDPAGFVLNALELPGQALFLEMSNVGYGVPSINDPSASVSQDPPYFVIALPQMNLTEDDFKGQTYNFINMRNAWGDESVGSMAIDSSGTLTSNGFSPWGAFWDEQILSPIQDFDEVTFPGGTYPASYLAATDTVQPPPNSDHQNPLYMRPNYLFGYPGSLVIYNASTLGTFVGVPQNSTPDFQSSIGGNPITGTYKVLFHRKQVNGNPDQYGIEPGPSGTWKGLPQVDGASMGYLTLHIADGGIVTMTDTDGSQPWTGTLQPLSTVSLSSIPNVYGTGNGSPFTLYGNGNDGGLKDPGNGLYAMQLNNGSGPNQQEIQVYLSFVPGPQPAVVMSTFTLTPTYSQPPNYNPPPSTIYQYRYGMGFRTGN